MAQGVSVQSQVRTLTSARGPRLRRQWPTLTLLLEGGPDDGLVVSVPAGASPEPPEELLSAVDPLGRR